MQVNELNEGEKAQYSLDGKVLDIDVKDQGISLDLAQEQEDEEKTIDICLNKNGELVIGVDNWYIANITIPAAEYDFQDNGETDEQGNIVYEKVKKPLNTDNVVLDLWALPNFIKKTNQDEGVVN